MLSQQTKSEIISLLEAQTTYITVDNILSFLRIKGISISRRLLRLYFEEMLMQDEVLIVRSNKGIKIVRCEIDFNELVHSYREQAKTLSIEANKSISVWNKRQVADVPQLELGLDF